MTRRGSRGGFPPTDGGVSHHQITSRDPARRGLVGAGTVSAPAEVGAVRPAPADPLEHPRISFRAQKAQKVGEIASVKFNVGRRFYRKRFCDRPIQTPDARNLSSRR